MSELLDTKQAAAYLGLHPQTLADWRYMRKGPKWLKAGGRKIRYRISDIDRWLEENTEKST